jgi:CheY-like chemotaxis protein
VHLARDGVEALELATRVKPVACFIDIGMPRINGYDVARNLRQLEGGSRPLLVATTGWGQADDLRQAVEAGFDIHMTKPVDLQRVSKALAEKRVPL